MHSQLPVTGMSHWSGSLTDGRGSEVMSFTRHAMLVGTALCLVAAGPAIAQTAAPAAHEATRSFDIPAQPLRDALRQLMQQGSLQIGFEPADIEGRTSTPVNGRMSVGEALSRMLTGTGLTFRYLTRGSVVIERAPQASGGAIQLGPVRVEGQSMADAGFVTSERTRMLQADGSAAEGYRSDQVSAIGPWEGRTLQDTPYSITVIPREMIENLQATTPDGIYRVAPTAQMGEASYRNDEPTVNLRGFQVYLPYRNGIFGDYLGLGTTTEDVERVEIFTGLSGFLYGAGNVGGMINYISKRPTSERFNRVTVGNSGGSNWFIQGDFGGPVDSAGSFGYRINGIWQGGETAIDSMRIKKRFISGAFDWHLTDRLLVSFDAAYRDYEVHGGPALWVLGGGVTRPAASSIDSSVSWSQPWKYMRDKMQRYSTQLRWDANETITLRSSWMYTKTDRDPNMLGLNIIQPDGTYTQMIQRVYTPGENAFEHQFTSLSAQGFADFNFRTGTVAHKLTVGLQYNRIGEEIFANNSPPPISYTGLPLDHPTYFDRPVPPHVDRGPRGTGGPDITRTTLLIGDDITLNDHWSLLAGIARSTIHNSAVDAFPNTPYAYSIPRYSKSAVTPNVSLIYKPVDAVTTYVTYIESLEQGGTAGADYNGVPVVNAGEVFAPLISKQVEVGAKAKVGDMLLTAALFQVDKALQYYDLSNPAAIRFVQDGRQVHRGIEFTGFGKLGENLTLTGGVTLLDAEVKEQKQSPALEGNRPPNVADTLIKLRAEYRLPFLPALSLSGGVIHTGGQYGDAANTDRMPGYTLFDVGARYDVDLTSLPVTLRLDIQNLTDEAYWSQAYTLGEPRTVLFSASTRF